MLVVILLKIKDHWIVISSKHGTFNQTELKIVLGLRVWWKYYAVDHYKSRHYTSINYTYRVMIK